MPEIAYVNGEFLPLDRAMVHVEDRGFQFADAVYEVLRVYDGRVFALAAHLERLFASLMAIDLHHHFTAETLHSIVDEAVRRSELVEAVVYLQITRGCAPRHRAVPPGLNPTLVLTVRELEPPPATLPATGVALETVDDLRWARCDIKSVALLPNVLAFERARQHGADDALFVDATGQVAESTAGNIFLVSESIVRTPPKTPRLLAGVTRDAVISIACEQGLACREEEVHRDDLATADEVFLTSTTSQIVPVTTINSRAVGDGQTGPVTNRLYRAFLEFLSRQ